MSGLTEMELRVAAAICAADSQSRAEPIACSFPGCGCTDIPAMARAAIRAMREPTSAMIEASYGAGTGDVSDTWPAMIDAATAPPEPPKSGTTE